MPDMTDPQRGAYERLPPTDVGQQALVAVAITAVASNFDLNGLWGEAAPGRRGITFARVSRGGAWFSFQAAGGVAYIRFQAAAGAPGASAANGCIIEDGRTEEFWCTNTTRYLDAVSTAPMTLKVWMSSRNYTHISGA